MTGRSYWVRTEHGRVWGPYTVAALERLRGQLTEKAEASVDGKEWHPGMDFPELRELLQPARKIERTAAPPPAPRISRAMAEAFGLKDSPAGPAAPGTPSPAPASPASPVAAAPKAAPAPKSRPASKPAPAAPAGEAPLEVPASGDLSSISPARLYGLIAATASTGLLVLEPENGQAVRIAFRRGAPEHLSSDAPDLSLARFLQSKGILPAAKAQEAEEQARKSGQDLLSVLFQLQLIPPADAHKLLGDHAAFLLDRAVVAWKGTFAFEKDAPLPPGGFPLGQRWALLAEAVRRIDAPLLRARLGKRLVRPVGRSGGLALGKVEELGMNAQEARLYAGIDGTRTGEALLQAHDAATALRLLHLLVELGHLAFVETEAEAAPPPPPSAPAAPRPAPAQATAPRELPKIVRDPGRPAPRPQAAAPRAPPPVMQGAAPAKPPSAPAITRPPPTFAIAPEGETKEQAIERLSALFEKLANVDHFQALGMERKGASAAEAKRNFVVLARELHPDTVADPADADLREVKERVFSRINEAAQVVGDDKRRKDYEAELDGKAASVDVARIFAAEENFQRAEILIKARKYKEGLEHLDKAIALNDKEAEFFAWRGYAHFLLAQDRKAAFEGCAADCRKALQMQERCLPAHLFLGHMSKVVGDLKAARKCYTRVLELDEKHVEAQRELRLIGQKG